MRILRRMCFVIKLDSIRNECIKLNIRETNIAKKVRKNRLR